MVIDSEEEGMCAYILSSLIVFVTGLTFRNRTVKVKPALSGFVRYCNL
jgi:hypothetical protein